MNRDKRVCRGSAWLGLCAAVLLAGCDVGRRDDPFAAWPKNDPQLNKLRRRAAERTGRVPNRRPSRSEGAVELADEAGVERYVELALRRNPRIAAAKQRVARLAERVPQATALDDPMFQVSPVGEMAETAAGQVGLTTGIRQRVPWPGKLRQRGRIAARSVAEASAELERVRQEVAAEVRRAYWRLYRSVRAYEVTEESRSLLKDFLRIARSRYEAGLGGQEDVLRASVELANVKKNMHTLRQRRSAAEARLNRLLDRPVTRPVPDPPRVSVERATAELEALLRRAGQTNPSLRAVRQRIRREREKLELAKLNRWPDPTFGASYAAVDEGGIAPSATGEDQWWFTLGFNLPIWAGKLEAAEQEARRGVLEGLSELRATRNRVDFEVREAFDRMTTHRHHLSLLRGSIVPEAEQAVEAAMSRYRAGETDALDVIDHWRRMLEFERMLYEHRTLFERAAADLQRAIGQQLERAAPRETGDGGSDGKQTPEKTSGKRATP